MCAMLSVRVENDEVLNKEMTNLIQGAVRGKVRGFFEQTANEETGRIIEARFKDWDAALRGESRLAKFVRDRVDLTVENHLDKFPVYGEAYQKGVNEKIARMDQRIDSAVDDALSKIDIEGIVSNVVAQEVARMLPKEILSAVSIAIATAAAGQQPKAPDQQPPKPIHSDRTPF